jgi:hypothetical protein
MILMNSKVSEGSDVAYINVQSWHFLDGTEESYKKREYTSGSPELISTRRKRKGSPLLNLPISSAFILTLRMSCLWGETAKHPLASFVCGRRLQQGLSN